MPIGLAIWFACAALTAVYGMWCRRIPPLNADISRGWPRIRTMPTAKDAFYSFRIEDEPPKLYMVEMLLKEVVPHA